MLKLARDLQGVALVSENLRVVKKKKKKAKDLIGLAGTNIVGSSLIKAQAEIA